MSAERRSDRRKFLGNGLRSAAGLAAAGLAGGGLLEACSTSATTRPKPAASSYGGQLTWGTWSEVNSLSPPQARWDATGYLYANALFDSLVQLGADGKPYPYLARSVTPSADFTSYTIGLRPEVVFHDGEPCDAAAVQGSLEAVATGTITSQSLKPIKDIRVSGPMTVVVDLDQPWPAFPSYLSTQLGYIASPKMLKSKAQGTLNAIGTGPFKQEEWVLNQHLVVQKNRHYWQKGYPYLDQLTFVPITDNQAREDALKTGSIQVAHFQNPATIKDFIGNKDFEITDTHVPSGGMGDVDFIMLNVAVPPLNDPNLRLALAQAIDVNQLARAYGVGLTSPARGPFQPGSLWYGSTGYPSYDAEAARRLVDDYRRRHGGPPKISLATIAGAAYQEITQLIQAMWSAVGIDCATSQIDITQFITDAVLGNYQACTFEQFGASDPDQNYVWWSTTTVAPVGQVSLNLAHNSDPRIETQLLLGRHSTVPSERRAAYQEVARLLAEDLPYLWLGKTLWVAIAEPNVAGIRGQTLPGGQPGIGFFDGSCLVQQLRLNG